MLRHPAKSSVLFLSCGRAVDEPARQQIVDLAVAHAVELDGPPFAAGFHHCIAVDAANLGTSQGDGLYATGINKPGRRELQRAVADLSIDLHAMCRIGSGKRCCGGRRDGARLRGCIGSRTLRTLTRFGFVGGAATDAGADNNGHGDQNNQETSDEVLARLPCLFLLNAPGRGGQHDRDGAALRGRNPMS